jgi:hypothetical protein
VIIRKVSVADGVTRNNQIRDIAVSCRKNPASHQQSKGDKLGVVKAGANDCSRASKELVSSIIRGLRALKIESSNVQSPLSPTAFFTPTSSLRMCETGTKRHVLQKFPTGNPTRQSQPNLELVSNTFRNTCRVLTIASNFGRPAESCTPLAD